MCLEEVNAHLGFDGELAGKLRWTGIAGLGGAVLGVGHVGSLKGCQAEECGSLWERLPMVPARWG